MKKITNLLGFALLFIFLLNTQQLNAQSESTQKKKDKKTAQIIYKVGAWESYKTEKNGAPFNLESIAGKATMTFIHRTLKKTKEVKETGKVKKYKEIVNSFKMEMGGNDRIFNFTIENDSIKFIKINGFSDYRIVRVDAAELVLEQELDNSLFRWVMRPKKKEKKVKKQKRRY